MLKKSPRIAVLGTGAIGGFYGAKLAQSDASVSFIARSDYNKIAKDGLEITSKWGDFHVMPEVYPAPSAYPHQADYILVTLKVLPEVPLIEMLGPLIKADTAIVLLQNGIDIEDAIAKAYPDTPLYSAISFVCANRISPGHIHHIDYGQVVMGRYPKGSDDMGDILCTLFQKSGIPCKSVPDIRFYRWRKLVWNAAFNPLSVLSGGVTTDTILANSKSRELVAQLMAEIVTLSIADGYALPFDIIASQIHDTEKMVPYKTSMLLDFEHHRPMEIDAIIGNACKIARHYQVSTPYLDAIYALLELLNQSQIQTQ